MGERRYCKFGTQVDRSLGLRTINRPEKGVVRPTSRDPFKCSVPPEISQSVSLQVALSHPPGGRLPLLSACGYLPSQRALPPIGQYQIILLGDRGTWV